MHTRCRSSYDITIQPAEGDAVVEKVPAGPELIVSQGEEIVAGAALTSNPNVGGFGQRDIEIVLQSPNRIKGLSCVPGRSYSDPDSAGD